MRYRIKRIKSKEMTGRRLMLMLCALIYLLAFVLSEAIIDSTLPKWIFQTH